MLLYTRESHRSVLKFPSCPRTQHCDHSSVTLDDVSTSTHTRKPMTSWVWELSWVCDSSLGKSHGLGGPAQTQTHRCNCTVSAAFKSGTHWNLEALGQCILLINKIANKQTNRQTDRQTNNDENITTYNIYFAQVTVKQLHCSTVTANAWCYGWRPWMNLNLFMFCV